jgi:hypothetical protein
LRLFTHRADIQFLKLVVQGNVALRSRAWDRMRVFQEKYEYLITLTT